MSMPDRIWAIRLSERGTYGDEGDWSEKQFYGDDTEYVRTDLSPWIPVSERLPDEADWYFAMFRFYGRLVPDCIWFIPASSNGKRGPVWGCDYPVECWMPIPPRSA